MKTYVVAVSGGVDSVVLLHQLVTAGEYELVVAHFDHGIRQDSSADARFVEGLAASYQLPFVSRREELGATASEERARTRRYAFLRQVAQDHQGVLVTAHHGDDMVETIAINISRGTGWRGVAVLAAADIVRPILHMSKQQIRDYALAHRLEWVEDSTNASLAYLRNQLRRLTYQYLRRQDYEALQKLRFEQSTLKVAIENEVRQFIRADAAYDRYFMTHIDDSSAGELLRAAVWAATGVGLTRPQCERALLAIKTARPRSRYDCGSGVTLRFDARTFIVETT